MIHIWSTRKNLHVIALKIFQFGVDNGIELEMQWIPRTKLDRADFISRITDVDDWQMTTSFFEFLDYTLGPHTVDSFANFYNTKVKKFIQGFGTQVVAEWISSFRIRQGKIVLLFPRVNLIHRTIHYLYTSKAFTTLVVPFWPSSYFWPIIGRNFFSFVMDYKLFSGRTVPKHGRNTNSLLGSKRFFGLMLAVRMKF